MKIGFSNEKYLQMQSEHIKERINTFGGKLYLEFGGKLYDDYHASRVLPGFKPDSKLQMLMKLKNDAEIIIVINAMDIEKNKIRSDIGISYEEDVLRLISLFSNHGLYVGGVTITRYTGQPSADTFKKRLENLGFNVYLHYPIAGYPSDIDNIISDKGYGKNDYIKTTKPLVVITAPGPGSGKMATCISQLYHENKRGIKAGYAKFETFPIWNLSLSHPVNLAYEAATADLNDVNMIDPYHLEAYGVSTVNYNRDIEIFPVLNAMFNKIYGDSPYKSPTDMGVNMAGNCIIDDNTCCEASKQEIIRRYFEAAKKISMGINNDEEILKIKLLMNKAGISLNDRKIINYACERSFETNGPAAAMELDDGTIVTGKTSDLLGPTSAVVLNALKHLAKIDHSETLISPEAILPLQTLKTKYLGSHNPRLHLDETLIALSLSVVSNKNVAKALKSIPLLRGNEFHSTVLLSTTDMNMLKKIGINATMDPKK